MFSNFVGSQIKWPPEVVFSVEQTLLATLLIASRASLKLSGSSSISFWRFIYPLLSIRPFFWWQYICWHSRNCASDFLRISFHLCIKAGSAPAMIGRALTCERQNMTLPVLAYGLCFAAFVSCVGEIWLNKIVNKTRIVILLDLRKAFDLVNTHILLKKLSVYQCDKNTIDPAKTAFTKRNNVLIQKKNLWHQTSNTWCNNSPVWQKETCSYQGKRDQLTLS